MNNFTFGNARHQYYETLCGGAGAGPGFDGASAVHTHMTNSRLTDPEVLEQRYPVRIVQVRDPPRLRRRGPLARRRRRRPRGRVPRADAGRDPVEPPARRAGRARRRLAGRVRPQLRAARATAAARSSAATAAVELAAGDRFVIETPGGGGYGAGLAEMPLGVADGPHLGREARGVVAEVVGQELVRRARRETDAQRDGDVARVALLASSAALVRTKNACSAVAPASAPRCFSRDRKIHTCRSRSAAS